MFSKTMIVMIALAIFMAVPAFASNAGCKNGKFVGAYTLPNPNVDIFGDGSVVHTFTFQLNLQSDGTASQYWTGFPDYIINLGTGSPWIGSWTCRRDGKLVITFIRGTYTPVAPGPNNPNPDIQLVNHVRNTYLFSIDDENTITRIQARARVYNPSQDPTDPAGGTLGALNTATVVYTRLEASDADLLLP